MKKFVALLLAALMVLGCTAMAETVKMDELTFQFVPSKDADVIIRYRQPARPGEG